MHARGKHLVNMTHFLFPLSQQVGPPERERQTKWDLLQRARQGIKLNTHVYYNPFTEVVIVRDGLKVGYASELGVGGVPVLFLAAELGQRPAT